MRRSSMNTRSPETPRSSGAATEAACAVSGSGSKPRSSASRTSRRTRRGSSANARGEAMRRRRAARSSSPPRGSISSPPATGVAIALMVKSRSARSADSEPPRSGWTSTCQEPSRATTRQPEKSSESSKQAAPPAVARAIARAAACAGVSTTMSRSIVSRPSARSRGAPPTSHAGLSARAARTTRSASRGAVSLTTPARRRDGRRAVPARTARR